MADHEPSLLSHARTMISTCPLAGGLRPSRQYAEVGSMDDSLGAIVSLYHQYPVRSEGPSPKEKK